MLTRCFSLFFLLLAAQAQAGGFLISHPANGRALLLEERSQQVDLKIQDQFAVTTTEQVFYNPSHQRIEGYFAFPVPKGAVVKKFKMEINGRMTEGELLDAGKARKIYEDIVRQMKDPALLEYVEQGLFKVRIFPIEPRRETKIRFTYTEALRADQGMFFYDYVMTSASTRETAGGAFAFKADVQAKGEVRQVYCPSHEVEVLRKSPHQVVVSGESDRHAAKRDLRLYITHSSAQVGMDLLSFKESGEDGFFFLLITPEFQAQQKVQPKDISFVLDVSGSMAGDKLAQAQRALQFCVANLNPEDRFEVIRFSTEAQGLFGKLQQASAGAKVQAKQFINDFRAIGGTNIQDALSMALANSKGERPHSVIFLTDGKPTIGERNESALLGQVSQKVSQHTRIFTFGIGHEINTHLLDKITEQTGAYRSYVTPEEDIEVKVSRFYTKVSSPVMSNLKLDFGSGAVVDQVYPKTLPDLFAGESVTVFGRYRQPGNRKVTLRGTVNGAQVDFSENIELANGGTPHDFIPSLWASRAVGYLLDEIRLHGETQELRQEVVRLARKYGIITPYTSYLILEDEPPIAPRPNPIRPVPQPFPQPQINPRAVQNLGLFDREAVQSNGYAYNWSYSAATKAKEGEAGVAASEDFQTLRMNSTANVSLNLDSTMAYRDKSGVAQNMANMNAMVNGKALYNNGSFWVDPELQQANNANRVDLKFGSEAYFAYLNSNLDAGPYLALGRNVQFLYNNTWVVVTD